MDRTTQIYLRPKLNFGSERSCMDDFGIEEMYNESRLMLSGLMLSATHRDQIPFIIE